MAKIYSCNLCPFKTGDRKKIREHVRKAHGITGGSGHGVSSDSPITAAYTVKEVSK